MVGLGCNAHTPMRCSLPITREAGPDESGMSLLLRIASANLATISWLRNRLNILQPRPFRSTDAGALASLVDVPAQELADRLPDSGYIHGHVATRYFGTLSLSRAQQRFARPQVCPECLHTTGYCRACWDFSCYTVCEEHMTAMVDRCASCQRRLTWNRPAIDVCICGAYIGSGDPLRTEKEAPALLISRRIAMAIGGERTIPSASLKRQESLPPWWSHVSLDGCLRILVAMGAIDRPLTAFKVAALQQAPSLLWKGIVERGLMRLQWAVAHPDDELKQLASVVWEGGLESIALDHVSHPDRQVAHLLAEAIFDQKFAGRFGSFRGQLSQRALF